MPGLKERVRVAWGPYAVPHLSASNEHDLFMAQGYVHAQERLWQMDSTRRLLVGRVAEIYGERILPWKDLSIHLKDKTTVDIDHFIRLIGIRRTARASLGRLSEKFYNLLLAYSEGVNRYIETHLNCLPVEFRLLRYEPEPWTPEDSLVIGKGFAFFLSTSLFTRLTLTLIADKLKSQDTKLKSLYPSSMQDHPCITRYSPKLILEASEKVLHFLEGTFSESPWSVAGQGSNSWVVAPRRSGTGRSILCNDPHLRMALPSTWYLIHLNATPATQDEGAYEVWGASIPGSPCVHLGHNRSVAWGVTAAICDDADLYREKIHPNDPDLYFVEDRWTQLEQAEEKIRIRGGKEIAKRIRFTRHGPVISDVTSRDPNSEVLTFRWTAHDPSEELQTLYGVNRARDWQEFLRSLSHQVAPTLNYVYADREGNIGYSLAGAVPIRPRSVSFLPLPGWSGEHEWKGYIPFEELPRLYNPPGGILATANNRITDSSYPYHLSDLFDPPYRVRRIRDLLSFEEKLSLKDMARIQQDVVSLHATDTLASLNTVLSDIAAKDSSLREIVKKLVQWNGVCSATSIEASIFHMFFYRLTVNLLTPDLGSELVLAYTEIFNQFLAPLNDILRDPHSPWFASRPRSILVEASLREAVEELRNEFGADTNQWHWGKLHPLVLRHPFGQKKWLAPLFSIGPFASPGSGTTINMGFYRHSDPYQHVVGASLRMVIDVGNWEASGFILCSGQSGHPFSPHYKDQAELWRRGEYLHLAYNKQEMDQMVALVLAPASPTVS